MKEKRELDLGTGEGGEYLTGINSNEVDYYCVDQNIDALSILRKRNSSISAVRALAEHMPFREKTFDCIVILFPGGSILSPGLQSHVPFPPEMKHDCVERSGARLYEELAGVLKKQGKLEIYGDWMFLADEIISKKEYNSYFKFLEKKDLSDLDVSSLGTGASKQTLLRRRKNLESPACSVIFQKKRPY